MKRFFTFIIFAALSVAMFGVSGHITMDTTWNTNQIVTGVLYIDAGVTLSIMPGVQVTFPKIDQNANGIGDIYIEVSGRLQVQGTVSNKVVFRSNQTTPAPSDWLGIKYLTPQSGMLSTISNAEILYAHEPLFVNGRNLTLNKVRIAYSGDYGMRINNTFLTTNITNCTIEENAGYGLLIEAGPVNITGLNLFHNGDYGIRLEDSSLVSASDIVSSTNAGHGILVLNDMDATITNSRFVSNSLNGAELQSCTVSFTNCDFSNNTFGVNFSGTTGLPVFNNCSIRFNDFGVRLENQQLSFNLCNVEFNTYYGVFINNAIPVINNCNITNNGNHSYLDPISVETLTVGTWYNNNTIPQAIWNLMTDVPDHPKWIKSLTYKKDGDGRCNGVDSYQSGSDYWYRNFSKITINTSTYLDHQFSQFVVNHVYCPIHHYANHHYYDMGEITVEGSILANVLNPEDMAIEVYNGENCPNARAWVTSFEYFHMRQVDCIVLNTNSTFVVNLQNNWWGDIEYVTSNVQQYIAGTANLNGAAASRISNAGSVLTNLVPSVSLVAPTGMTLNPASVSISWTDRDLDDNAMISLYYTEDPAQQGTLIAENISEDSSINSYTWDCSGVPNGTYYIKAVISDGVNPPVTSVSSGRVMVGALQVKMPPNATGVAGTQVLIPVQTVNTTDYFNIISFQFTLTYSNNIIQGVGVDTENTLTGETWMVYANTSIPGQISVNGFSTEPLNTSGNLVNIVFQVQPGAANYATSPLNFADLVLNNGSPEPTLVNGLFRVVNQYSISGNVHYYMGTAAAIANVALSLTGDQTYQALTQANGNFVLPPCLAGNYVLTPSCTTAIPSLVVTPFDASLTAQFALGLYPFSNEQQKAADVNGDNQATVFDAALIAQYSVGLITSFTPGIWGFSPPNQNYNLVSNFTNVQFLGFAIGDPSGNWAARGSEENGGTPIPVASAKGSSFSLPISWDQDFVSGYVQLRFDHQQLRYLGTEYSSATNSQQHITNVNDGVLRIASYGVQPVSSAEPVYNIRFEVLDGANDSVVYLDAVQFDENPAELGNTGIVDGELVPVMLSLDQNYPNPFNPVTNIRYSNPSQSRVRLSVFNLKGQMVKEVVNGIQVPGNYTVSLDASDLGSGIYFYRLDTATGSITRKMVLTK